MSWSCRYFVPDNTAPGGKGRERWFSIPHAGQEGTGFYQSMAEKRANAPKHGDGISLREMAALVDVL